MAITILYVLALQPLAAADAGTPCCADLEARITELELEATRSHARRLELKISGAVNRAVLVWDDGVHRDAAIVTNDNDGSVATIEGETANFGHGWTAGFELEFDLLDAGSGDVSQSSRGGTKALEIGELSVWFKNEQIGQISIGKTSARGASSGANEQDLSGTEVASYAGVSDVGGGFFLRRDGSPGLLNLKWDDVIDSLDEPDGNAVTYSSPAFSGFSFSGHWGEDDVWNVAGGYHGSIGPELQIAGAIAVNENREGQADLRPDHRTVSGSISALHSPTGLSLTIAGGRRSYVAPAELTDGTTGPRDDSFFGYGKLGWRGMIVSAGPTAAYVEYGRFSDFLGRDSGARTVEALGGLLAGQACAGRGVACFVPESTAEIWGFGVVQTLETSESQFYLSIRHFEADIKLEDAAGSPLTRPSIGGLDTIMAGMLIEF